MKNKIIIALAAPIAAGKTSIAKYIQEKTDSDIYKYSEILSEILFNLKIKNNRKNLQILSQILRENFGQDILEIGILKKIRNSKNKIIILDGIRRKDDILKIRSEYNLFLIFIDADLSVRIQRIIERAEKKDDAEKDIEKLKEEDKHNSDVTVFDLKKEADFIIDNNRDFENTKKQIDEILEKILN